MLRSDRRTLVRPVGCSRYTGPFCNVGPALAKDPRCMAEVPATAGGRRGRLVATSSGSLHKGLELSY